MIDTSHREDLLIVQVYVDDIIFGASNEKCKDFSKLIQMKFDISLIGELRFFLGLQVKLLEINACH